MTTEYTVYQCSTCHAKYAAPGPCPMGCKPLTEQRVREIAFEVMNGIPGFLAVSKTDEKMRDIAREEIRAALAKHYHPAHGSMRSEEDFQWAIPSIDKMEGMVPASDVQRARDAALEEAADLVTALGREAWIKGNVGAVCEKIRALKSQPEQPQDPVEAEEFAQEASKP